MNGIIVLLVIGFFLVIIDDIVERKWTNVGVTVLITLCVCGVMLC
jgi:hypothetical protein